MWDSYVYEEEENTILNAKKIIIKNENGQVSQSQINNMMNTVIYAILKNYVENLTAYQERNSSRLKFK